MNDRLKDIEEDLKDVQVFDPEKNIRKKYEDELRYFKFIDSVVEFSLLPLVGSIKYVNKYDQKLRGGGILIKIYQNKKTNKWQAALKNIYNKKYYICFDSNYIFYRQNKESELKDLLKSFMTSVENDEYDII